MKLSRQIRHKGIVLNNKLNNHLKESRQSRVLTSGTFSFPYFMGAAIYCGILAYYSINSLDLPEWHIVPSVVAFTLFLMVQYVRIIYDKKAWTTFLFSIYNLGATTICCLLLPYHLPLWVAITIGITETALLFLLSITDVSTVTEHYHQGEVITE